MDQSEDETQNPLTEENWMKQNNEVWGVYIDFQSIYSKRTIDAILQHMGFYVTTENPNVMMRENHNTHSSEYIIICQD